VVEIDLDIDSDNNNHYDEPPCDDSEDLIETAAGWPGKALALNELDTDMDGVPDYADGYDITLNSVSQSDSNRSKKFVPMRLKVRPTWLFSSSELGDIRVKFSSGNDNTTVFSDPSVITPTGSGTSNDPIKFTPDSGKIRIWKKDGNALRNKQSVTAGGDWVKPNIPIKLSELNVVTSGAETGVCWLFVEAVNPSSALGDVAIKVELVPSSTGPLGTLTADDQVNATVFQVDVVHPIGTDFANGQTNKVMISTKHDTVYHTTAQTTAADEP